MLFKATKCFPPGKHFNFKTQRCPESSTLLASIMDFRYMGHTRLLRCMLLWRPASYYFLIPSKGLLWQPMWIGTFGFGLNTMRPENKRYCIINCCISLLHNSNLCFHYLLQDLLYVLNCRFVNCQKVAQTKMWDIKSGVRTNHKTSSRTTCANQTFIWTLHFPLLHPLLKVNSCTRTHPVKRDSQCIKTARTFKTHLPLNIAPTFNCPVNKGFLLSHFHL